MQTRMERPRVDMPGCIPASAGTCMCTCTSTCICCARMVCPSLLPLPSACSFARFCPAGAAKAGGFERGSRSSRGQRPQAPRGGRQRWRRGTASTAGHYRGPVVLAERYARCEPGGCWPLCMRLCVPVCIAQLPAQHPALVCAQCRAVQCSAHKPRCLARCPASPLQAIGRVIRHRRDYGAIILCDERFRAPVSCPAGHAGHALPVAPALVQLCYV
jgi:hypothetical protein